MTHRRFRGKPASRNSVRPSRASGPNSSLFDPFTERLAHARITVHLGSPSDACCSLRRSIACAATRGRVRRRSCALRMATARSPGRARCCPRRSSSRSSTRMASRRRACGSTGSTDDGRLLPASTARPTTTAGARPLAAGPGRGRAAAQAALAGRRARGVHGRSPRARDAVPFDQLIAARLRHLRRLGPGGAPRLRRHARPARSAGRSTWPSRPYPFGNPAFENPSFFESTRRSTWALTEGGPNPVVLPGDGLSVRSRSGLRARRPASSGCITGRSPSTTSCG